MTENRTELVVTSSMKSSCWKLLVTTSNWKAVSSAVAKVSVLGPILFNIFIKHLDDRRESAFIRFAGNTKLGGVADVSEGCAAIHDSRNRLEKWANRNLMKFNEEKC